MYFFYFLVPLILVDYIEPIDELFLSFDSEYWNFIQTAVVNFIPDFLNVISSRFLSRSLSVDLVSFSDRFSLILLSLLSQTDSVRFNAGC